MKPYLESAPLQSLLTTALAAQLPVGAICHGVVLAARSLAADGRSVLFGKKTTALTRPMELTAWALTRAWLGDNYRTYPTTVEEEMSAALAGRRASLCGRVRCNGFSWRRQAVTV
jgi:protease I